ncbi:MAG TPA: hypothetical protein VNH65_11495 [Candidatus Acidoferrum sp.]|nr:hypothetical protein [Candidatus Acidoferrum sp.]
MERPTGVTILAVLYFIGAAFLGLCGILFIVGGSMLSGLAHGGGPGSALFAMGGAVVGGMFLVIAVLDLAIGIGFIKLQNWARIVAIILIGIGVLFGLIGLLSMFVHLMIFALVFRVIFLAIEIWILVYLFKPHVKQAFGATGF